MFRPAKFYVFLLIATVSAQYEYLVQFQTEIREESIPKILEQTIYENVGNITTSDILIVSKLDKLKLNEIQGLFNQTNIITIDILKTLMKLTNHSIITTHQQLKENLAINDENIQKVWQSLQITNVGLPLVFKNETHVYEVLSNGNYNESALNEAQQIIGKDLNEIYRHFREIMVAQAVTQPVSNLQQLPREQFNDLYKTLNITKKDVFQVTSFNEMLSSLNMNSSCKAIGVFVDTNKILMHKQVHQLLQDSVNKTILKLSAGDVEVLMNPTEIPQGFVQLATKESHQEYIRIVQRYEDAVNCSYLTVDNGSIEVVDVQVDDFSVDTANSSLSFAVGSPLVCDGVLWGLAREENGGRILFDKFLKESVVLNAARRSVYGTLILVITAVILLF